MIQFLFVTLAISVIGVRTLLTSNFKFDFLLDLIEMATNYLKHVPTMISSIFLTPKVIMSGAISHSSYIITNLARDSYNFGIKLINYYIQSLTHHSTVQYIYYLSILILMTALPTLTLQTKTSSQDIQKFISWAQVVLIVQTLISIILLVASWFNRC